MKATIPTQEEVTALEAAGLVTVRPHNELPLRIVNYTPRAQFDRAWTPPLLQCRGLVFDHDWRVVARPLPKFFNYEEHLGDAPPAGPLPTGPFTVTEKYDGSLGIVFRWQDHVLLATRGSFHSEQAERGMELLYRAMLEKGWRFGDAYHTHLFEIIYPANRIVVDYGPQERLQWLTTLHTATGRTVEHFGELFGGIAHHPAHSPDELKRMERTNAEGYVLRYDNGQRVKVKHAEYVRLHALVTSLSTTSVWEHLRNGGSMDELLAPLPDEWMAWAKQEANGLLLEVLDRREAAKEKLMNIEHRLGPAATRKDFAAEVMKEEADLRPLLFLLYDDRHEALMRQIWKQVRPAFARPITGDQC